MTGWAPKHRAAERTVEDRVNRTVSKPRRATPAPCTYAGRPALRRPTIDERGDDQAPRRLFALAKCLHLEPVAQMFMDELSLDRTHRLQSNRPAFSYGGLHRLICGCAQSGSSPRAIPARVNDHRLSRRGCPECGPVGEMLDRIDGAAMVCDQRFCIIADELADEAVLVLVDDDV